MTIKVDFVFIFCLTKFFWSNWGVSHQVSYLDIYMLQLLYASQLWLESWYLPVCAAAIFWRSSGLVIAIMFLRLMPGVTSSGWGHNGFGQNLEKKLLLFIYFLYNFSACLRLINGLSYFWVSWWNWQLLLWCWRVPMGRDRGSVVVWVGALHPVDQE